MVLVMIRQSILNVQKARLACLYSSLSNPDFTENQGFFLDPSLQEGRETTVLWELRKLLNRMTQS